MKSETSGRLTIRRVDAACHSALAAFVAIAGLLASSCAIEGSEACDAHQVYQQGGTVIEYGVCVCDEAQGYVFDVAKGNGCRRCSDDQVIVEGKCTSPMPDAGLEEVDAETVSEPTGAGEPCATAADCASFDAKYCAASMGMCLVDKCAKGENRCGSASLCCDFSALFAGFSICVPDESLRDGDCPMGGMRVDQ